MKRPLKNGRIMKATIIHAEDYESGIGHKRVALESLAEDDGPFLLTKGVFDILHFGHLNLFTALSGLKRTYGASLVVSITSDRLVKKAKGDKRPFQDQGVRSYQIAALPMVDYVFINDEEMAAAIKVLRPSLYVKGMDTALAKSTIDRGLKQVELPDQGQNSELAALRDVGGELVVFCDAGKVSTTSLAIRITQGCSSAA